ncbi:MAG: response regulator transcription factor [Pseudomonadota bacterium]
MRVLVVEDDAALSAQVVRALSEAGITADAALNGEDGCHLGETETYDAIVLDLGLPIMDGTSILRQWRGAGIQTPVLILTARGGWQDRVDGLNAGGDDYLGKPFHMEELLARIRALIRRSSGIAEVSLSAGDVALNTVSGNVTRSGATVRMTATEFKILSSLMLRPDRIHTKTELSEMVYGMHEDRDSNTIEVFIGRLRRKLGAERILTVRGLGYRISQE